MFSAAEDDGIEVPEEMLLDVEQDVHLVNYHLEISHKEIFNDKLHLEVLCNWVVISSVIAVGSVVILYQTVHKGLNRPMAVELDALCAIVDLDVVVGSSAFGCNATRI